MAQAPAEYLNAPLLAGGGDFDYPAAVVAAPSVPAAVPPNIPGVLVVSRPTQSSLFPHVPASTVCPHCGASIITEVRQEIGTCSWLTCLGLSVIGCIPCCIIPFFINQAKDTEHWCTSCHRLIARKNQIDIS